MLANGYLEMRLALVKKKRGCDFTSPIFLNKKLDKKQYSMYNNYILKKTKQNVMNKEMLNG